MRGPSLAHRLRTGWRRAAMGLLLCGALLLPGGSRPAAGGLRWLVAASGLERLISLRGGMAMARTAFDNPGSFVIVGVRPPGFLRGWSSALAISVSGYPALQAALARSTPPPGVRAVVYDQEAWPFTPRAEQEDPAPYVRRAAQLVHGRGLLLIATPATDLAARAVAGTRTASPSAPYGPLPGAFLALGLASSVAAQADVYEVQAQGEEGDVAAYRAFVAAAAAQARRAHPGVVVLAGLSTNPSGRHVSAGQLYADVAATRGIVAGYWLNIPAAGPACPRCGTPRPQVALGLLRMLYG